MKQYVSLRLEGAITAESQLATSPPNTPTGTPAASPLSDPPIPLPRMSMTVEGGTVTLVPYFPGGGIRGKLRRMAEEVVRLGLVGEEGVSPFGVDDAYYLRNGGVKGAEKEDKADILEAQARREKNPLIALFGAGAPWDMGRLSVGHARPMAPLQVDVVRGVRRDDFSRGGDALVALAPEARKHWLEMSQRKAAASADRGRLRDLERAARREKDAEGKRRAEAEALALKEEIDRREAELGVDVSVLMPLAGYEAIPAGTRLAHDFTMLRVRECEVGLFLMALDRLAQNPVVGAHSNHGCGIISGTWNVAMRVGDLGRYEDIGEIAMKPFRGIEVPERLANMQQAFTTPLDAGEFDFRAPTKD
jgi:CRISPR type IV-associated protein Csf2